MKKRISLQNLRIYAEWLSPPGGYGRGDIWQKARIFRGRGDREGGVSITCSKWSKRCCWETGSTGTQSRSSVRPLVPSGRAKPSVRLKRNTGCAGLQYVLRKRNAPCLPGQGPKSPRTLEYRSGKSSRLRPDRMNIMESLILAQNERWRRVLSMQVER